MTHNEEQYKAICHHEGPAMVLAGPGVGKTYVITNRIKTLIEDYRVPAHKILVVTFSKMAALEMQQRFDEMMGGKHLPVQFGTFHSIFFVFCGRLITMKERILSRRRLRCAFWKKRCAT